MRIITVANQRGGAGKTTITHNLAGVLAERGDRVLLVDVDPQFSLSSRVAPDVNGATRPTLAAVLFDSIPLEQAIQSTNLPGVSYIPGHLDLDNLERRFGSDVSEHYVLADLLEQQADNFDFVLIDCPPSLNINTRLALMASDAYLIPVTTDKESIYGAHRIKQVADTLPKYTRRELRLLGVLPSRLVSNRKITEHFLEQFKKEFGEHLLATHIKETTKVQQAAFAGVSVAHQAQDDSSFRTSADTFRSLIKELNL